MSNRIKLQTLVISSLFLAGGASPSLQGEAEHSSPKDPVVDQLFQEDSGLQELLRKYGIEPTAPTPPPEPKLPPETPARGVESPQIKREEREPTPQGSSMSSQTNSSVNNEKGPSPVSKRKRRFEQTNSESPQVGAKGVWDMRRAPQEPFVDGLSNDEGDYGECGYNPESYGRTYGYRNDAAFSSPMSYPGLCGSFTLDLDYIRWNVSSQLQAEGSRLVQQSLGQNFFDFGIIGNDPFWRLFNIGDINRCVGKGEISHQWGNGIKLGFRYQTPCSFWNFGFRWTHFNPGGGRHLIASGTDEIFIDQFFSYYALQDETVLASTSSPDPIFYLSFPHVTNSKDRWNLNLDLFDLEVSRPICLCQNLHVRPHMGLKFVSIDDKIKTDFDGVYVFPQREGDDIDVAFDGYAYKKSKFSGIGPRMGVGLEWDFFSCLGLYGNLAAAIAGGDLDAHERLFINRPIEAENEDFGNVDEKVNLSGDCSYLSILDVEVGISWHQSFCSERFGFGVKLGWESHFFHPVGNRGGPETATTGLVLGLTTHF